MSLSKSAKIEELRTEAIRLRHRADELDRKADEIEENWKIERNSPIDCTEEKIIPLNKIEKIPKKYLY